MPTNLGHKRETIHNSKKFTIMEVEEQLEHEDEDPPEDTHTHSASSGNHHCNCSRTELVYKDYII